MYLIAVNMDTVTEVETEADMLNAYADALIAANGERGRIYVCQIKPNGRRATLRHDWIEDQIGKATGTVEEEEEIAAAPIETTPAPSVVYEAAFAQITSSHINHYPMRPASLLAWETHYRDLAAKALEPWDIDRLTGAADAYRAARRTA